MRRWGVTTVIAVVVVAAVAGSTVRSAPRANAAPASAGYWLVATDGGIFSFGQAAFHGSTGNLVLNQPIVGMAATPSGRGYWMVATDGGIFAFGDARFLGSMGAKRLNQPIVAMTATPSGNGYWMVASDGGIFAFGDAGFYGSMGNKPLNKPIVDIAATPTGRGYWMVGSDGGIFSFGDARFFGGTGDKNLNKRIQAMAATPSGQGYWLVAGDGGLFSFGDARFFGSAASSNLDKRVLDIAPSASGGGYWMTTSGGEVFAYGDAKFYGAPSRLNHRITGIVPLSGNDPPVAVEDMLGVPEDSPQAIDVLANDRDPEGAPLTVTGVTTPGHGTASVVGGRSIAYTPAPDYNGPDSVTYTVADDRGGMATARVNIMVSAVDDLPRAADDSLGVDEDQLGAVSVLANDAGLGDGVKSLVVSGQASHGKATVNADLTVTYAPAANASGPDSFRYKVTDLDGDVSEASVHVTVNPVDDTPVAGDDTASTPAGKPVAIAVQTNDDPGDGNQHIELVDDIGVRGDSVPTAFGTAKRNPVPDGGDKVTYTPKRGTSPGTRDHFRYVVVDGDGDVSNPATVTITIDANAAPVAQNQELTMQVGETRSDKVHATDPDNDNLTYKVFGPQPANCQPFTFQPNGDFSCQASAPGDLTFQFVADDGNQESAPATVTIHVNPPPPGPAPTILGLGPAALLAPLARRRRRSPAPLP